MAPAARAHRSNSPFTTEEETWIILEFGALKNILLVRRAFRIKFKKNPKEVPLIMAFRRLVERFQQEGEVKPQVPAGRPPLSEEQVEEVRAFLKPYQQKQISVSVPFISVSLNMSVGTVWMILRKKLKLFPYKPHTTIPRSPSHKVKRKEFCDWFLAQEEDFATRVIWSDEKWFVLKQAPNKQNERYWAPVDPVVEVECREQGGAKVMCWAGILAGRIIIHWFDPGTSVTGESYLEMLQQVVWPQVRALVARRQLWFQQDGATVHTTVLTRAWLQEKFQGRVISLHTDRPWPAKSPDLSPPDFWLWGTCMQELRRNPPSTLQEMKRTVEGFVNSLSVEETKSAVLNLRRRALVCQQLEGGSFEARFRQTLAELRMAEE